MTDSKLVSPSAPKTARRPPPVSRRQFCMGVSMTIATLSAGLLLPMILSADGRKSGTPLPGLVPLGAKGSMQISDSDRCPVCAMRVSRHPKFACAIQLHDRITYYFCSAGCMIKSWLHPEIFLGEPREKLLRAVCREYFSGLTVDAGEVIWIAGSDVVGPMGPAVVPLAGEGHLEAFKRRHGGGATFRLSELTDTQWEAVSGRAAKK